MPPHCDSLDGPVVRAAQLALESGEVERVLPYVPAEAEDEIVAAFELAGAVRQLTPEARRLADTAFFETVVRVHRAAEGAPYSGLKPAGLSVGPVIPVAERAIAAGAPDELAALLCEFVEREVAHRFHQMRALEPTNGDVSAHRAYVEATLGLQVWAHSLYQAIRAQPHEHAEHGDSSAPEHAHA